MSVTGPLDLQRLPNCCSAVSGVMCHIRKSPRLFDHLVGAGDERRGHFNAKHFGGLEIDDQFKPGRLLDRQITGLCTFEYSVDVDCRMFEQDT